MPLPFGRGPINSGHPYASARECLVQRGLCRSEFIPTLFWVGLKSDLHGRRKCRAGREHCPAGLHGTFPGDVHVQSVAGAAIMSANPHIRAFFDESTHTISYLVADQETKRAAIVDPVLDFDQATGSASLRSADAILRAAAEDGLTIEWILETHAHADHLSAAPYLRSRTRGKVGIGEHIREVQSIFRPVFNLDDATMDGSGFARLFTDGERFRIGNLEAEVLYTPGHTPACVSYRIGDDVFVGDTLFMPDYGTARTDFPGGSAEALYRSIQRLLALPPRT